MICAWESLLGILPGWLRPEVNAVGKDRLQELRLRRNCPPELISGSERQWLRQKITQEDLVYCINAASRYSPWAVSSTAQGYLTAYGGHRIGICGEAVLREGKVTGIRDVHSLCIRVARDFPGIAREIGDADGSILILGAPGWGKTTLLRDLIRHRSETETVAVVDERGELFPEGFSRGSQTDVLSGCPKAVGILQLIRTMGPQSVAVDEITSPEDCSALLQADCCGVSLLATAHAGGIEEFRHRKIYESLVKAAVFKTFIILQKDQTYQVERNQL